ncbi:hypothetical protein PVAND_016791 [Polypedilum vanderplanki]|uniref:C-type lectin domain-containing protein n=1 Tax=Polypedilum vanderplanki TaxID=319348 RepID=A0A9J6BH15_POLVA|nr:hypothetical protein PVAND_016791 [Polypedilum vanderplanki]
MKLNLIFIFINFFILSNSQLSLPQKPLEVAYSRDLYHIFGKYLTTIIGTFKTGNYSTAEAFCRSNGFELFTISDSFTYFAFIMEFSVVIKNFMPPIIWINGKQFITSAWYAYNPKLALILHEMCPKISYSNGLNCLSFVTKSYGTQANNCSVEMPFICEIKRKLNPWEVVIINTNSSSNTSDSTTIVINSTTLKPQAANFNYNLTTIATVSKNNFTFSTTVANSTTKTLFSNKSTRISSTFATTSTNKSKFSTIFNLTTTKLQSTTNKSF